MEKKTFVPFDVANAPDPAHPFCSLRHLIEEPPFRFDYLPPEPPFRHQGYLYFHSGPLESSPEFSSVLTQKILPCSWLFHDRPSSEERQAATTCHSLLVGCLPECWLDDVQKFILSKRMKIDPNFPEHHFRYEFVFALHPDLDPLVTPPAPAIVSEIGLVTDSLHQEDLAFVQPFHSCQMPDEYISLIIRTCPTVCVRHPETRNPVAWVIQYVNDGSFGFLEVLPEFRRKGLAVYIVNLLVQKVKELTPNIPFVHAYTLDSNVSSMTLFGEKLGWKRVPGKFFWIQFSPVDEAPS